MIFINELFKSYLNEINFYNNFEMIINKVDKSISSIIALKVISSLG